MNRRRACGCVLGVLAGLLAGCNAMIIGQWRSIEPAEVPPDVPRVRQIEFKSDGQFQGRMTGDNRTQAVTGTYQFDGTWLTLTPDGTSAGGRFVYHVAKAGDVLRLTQNEATNRLCREPVGSGPLAAPALPEEPAQPAVIPIPAPASRSASAAIPAPASMPVPR